MSQYQKQPQRNHAQEAQLSEYVFGRTQPQSLGMEEAVLGAIMLDKSAFEIVASVLEGTRDPFYREAHTSIWAAMSALYARQQPIDLLTVMEQLKKAGNLETAGGPAYLAELTHRVASAANIEYHARIVWERAIERNLIRYHTEGIRMAYDPGVDAPTLLEESEKGLMSVTHGIGDTEIKTAAQIAAREQKRFEDICNNPGILTGIPTPYSYLNKLTGGWHPTDFNIVAARPAMGKTGMMLDFVEAAADAGHKVGIFSLEMSDGQLINRQGCKKTGIANSQIRNPGGLSALEKDKVHRGYGIVSDMPIVIDDTAGIKIAALRRKARQMVRGGVEIIFVDYLQLMSGGEESHGGNREQEISAISRGLKALAKELKIPVIALSQLSRAVETRGGTKRPQLSDLRESGSLEQDADSVYFIYRAEYYKILEDENGNSMKGKAELIVAKNRHGATDDVILNFHDKTATFYDPTASPPDNFEQPNPFSTAPAPDVDNGAMLAARAGGDDQELPF